MKDGESATEQGQGVKMQYLATLVVSLVMLTEGMMNGWSSPAIFVLTSDESPLPSGKINMDEASWLAALPALSCITGNIFCGFIINRFGRKWPMIFLSVPCIFSWLLILFAQNVYYLYVARLLHGLIIGGALLICPVYVIEIASDRVRGILAIIVLFIGRLGNFLAFIMGNYGDFSTIPIFGIVTSISFAALFPFFPETPAFLARQNRISDAEKSIRFYRNIRGKDSKLVEIEMRKLESAIGSKRGEGRRIKWSDLTTRPGSRAMIIAFVLVISNQFSGMPALLSYSATIFDAAGSFMSPNTSAMIVAAIQFMGTCVITPLIDRTGRRFLYILSTIGTAFGLIVLGVYMMLRSMGFEVEAYNWIPLVSFSATIFVASFAVSTLPIICTAEVMPEHLKEFGVSFAVSVVSICGFLIVKFLPLLASSIGFYGCMFFFAVISLITSVVIIFCLPETKGKSYEEIMNSLR